MPACAIKALVYYIAGARAGMPSSFSKVKRGLDSHPSPHASNTYKNERWSRRKLVRAYFIFFNKRQISAAAGGASLACEAETAYRLLLQYDLMKPIRRERCWAVPLDQRDMEKRFRRILPKIP